MPFSEEMRQLLTANNFQFLFNGLKLTLYISFVSIILSTIFGTILAVLKSNPWTTEVTCQYLCRSSA